MIDIETLATARNAQLLSIGACGFQFSQAPALENAMRRTFYTNVEAYADGMPFVQHATTQAWWAQQSDAAKQALEGNKREVRTAIIDFAVWCTETFKTFGAGSVWANPPQFDLEILRSHFDYLKIDCPWHWTKERDYRTLREIAKQKNGFHPTDPIAVATPNGILKFEKHNALHDAVRQANKVQQIMQHLMRSRGR